MRYIVSNFTPAMVKSDHYRCIVHKLSYSEFMELSSVKPSKELIRDEGLAELFGFEYSNKWCNFMIGDVLFCIYTNHEVCLENVDEFTNFKYYMIEIMEA